MPFQIILDYFRLYQTIFDYFRLFLTISVSDYFLLFQTISDFLQLIQTISNHFRLFQTITDYFRYFRLIQLFSEYYGLIQTISDCFWPFQTIADYFWLFLKNVTFQINIFSWREASSSICRLVTGTMAAPQASNTKLSITHSFFELQSPDFAWKFVWTSYEGEIENQNGQQIT